MKLKGSILVYVLLCFASFTYAVADDPITLLLKKLEEFTRKYPTEKIYLHLDKPYYSIGDDIWFKAYVIDSKTGIPTALSKVLYIEFINEKDSITKLLKLPMQAGIVAGDFKLTDELIEGNYRIRAYTQWMRNAGPQFFFDKTIKIGNYWANQVFTKVKYGQFSSDKFANVIQFLNNSEQPYVNSKITYTIYSGGKKIGGSKVATDAKGEITVNIPFTENQSSRPQIELEITLADGLAVRKTITVAIPTSNIDVQFFPEGGNLITGLPTKVAFKAINGLGLGQKISGSIIDNEGVEILRFETTYLGMGSFILTPQAGKTYTSKIKQADGKEQEFNLPLAKNSGFALAINNLDTAKIGMKVMLSSDLIVNGKLSLIAQQHGKVLFSAAIPSDKQITSLSVSKANFPSGIVQITLFSADNLPVSERVIFVNNLNDKIDIAASGLREEYKKREPVDFELLAKNLQQSAQGSFSIAVTNADVITPDFENETNILTSLLLTSDLTGYVEKPNHYFLNNDIKTRTELDHLLLTQGWRKINWREVNDTQTVKNIYSAEKSMKISGLVTSGGKPVAKGKVTLMSTSKLVFITDTLTDDNGRFNFDQISFPDSTRFSIKALTSNGNKNVKITLDDTTLPILTPNKNMAEVEMNVNETLKSYLQKSTAYLKEQENNGSLRRTNQLKTVEIKGEVKKASPTSANLNGPGKADVIFSADDLKNTSSLNNFLQGRVAGILLYEQRYYLTKNNPGMENPLSMNKPQPMAVYIDGVQMNESGFTLEDISITEIESVEILKSIATTSAYGTSDGVIIITTKTADGGKQSSFAVSGLTAIMPKGFSTVRQFYTPKYEVQSDNRPDLRTTVYWNPYLITTENGKTAVKYFNTDEIGNYRMVIEGIDSFGNLARKIFNYQVK